MARSSNNQAAAAAVAGEMTADEQAQLDEMRDNDAAVPAVEDQPPQAAPAVVDDIDDELDDSQADAGDQRQRTVPHEALHKERLRRQAVEAEAAAYRNRSEERMSLLLQRITQQPQAPVQQPQVIAPVEIPDVQTDPVGHILGRFAQQGQTLEQTQQVLSQVVNILSAAGQQNQHAQAIGGIQQQAMAMEREFSAATPDYEQAVKFLGEHRNKELQEAGWTNAVERQAMLTQEAQGIAQRAISMGQNPADVVYRLAKHRGYSTPALSADTPADTQQQIGQRLENVAQGQRQNGRSLGNVRGAAPAPMTANRLLEMSDDDFNKAMSTPEGREQLGV